jgi:sugar phosphate permease
MLLVLAIYLLRLFGQGMFTHIAMTAMGRWFAAQRGRAVSLTAIGVNLGEAVFPVSFVTCGVFWDGADHGCLAAGVLMVVALPVVYRPDQGRAGAAIGGA